MTIIDIRYQEGKSLIDYLIANKEISLLGEAENNFKKSLLLCTASYFEHEITAVLKEFSRRHSNSNPMIMAYIELQGINRKYHTLFDWDSNNINRFLTNFGLNFKNSFNDLAKQDKQLDNGIKAFMSLGSERNSLVHQNFAEYSLQKTADEIYAKYQEALFFITVLKTKLTV